jgi:protein SCO1/2
MDPARDGSTELSDHARLHRADGQRWRVAAPVDATEGARLQRDLGVVVVPDGFGGFVHNAGIHLIDGQGRLRAIRDFDQWEDALATARRMTQAAP